MISLSGAGTGARLARRPFVAIAGSAGWLGASLLGYALRGGLGT
jgi:hypothetical protein